MTEYGIADHCAVNVTKLVPITYVAPAGITDVPSDQPVKIYPARTGSVDVTTKGEFMASELCSGSVPLAPFSA